MCDLFVTNTREKIIEVIQTLTNIPKRNTCVQLSSQVNTILQELQRRIGDEVILSLLILETTHQQHCESLPHDVILSTFLVLNRNSVATQYTHQGFTGESGVVVVTIHGHTQHDLLQSSLLILNTLQEFLSGLLIIVNVKKQA